MTRPDRWFSYDPDNRFQRHSSAEAAKAEAQRALDYARDEAGDGWPEETHTICWGEVHEEAAEEITHKHGPDCKPADDDDEQHECTDGYDLQFDYVSEFDLTPMAEADRAEAAEQRAEAAEAALVLACPHCGPTHFAGPDADGTCAMCMGALIRADAAGAVLAHELYNGAHVAEAALATARAEGAAAERARILDVIRKRAADRAAQAAVCAEAVVDVVHAKASECEALAAIIDGTATMPRWPGRPVEGA